jgi:hypothetical protein
MRHCDAAPEGAYSATVKAVARAIAIFGALLAFLGTCVWHSGDRKPQAKIFDPKQCSPEGVHCGGTASTLCCGKFQLCCSTVMGGSYCATSCPKSQTPRQ